MPTRVKLRGSNKRVYKKGKGAKASATKIIHRPPTGQDKLVKRIFDRIQGKR